MAEEVIYDSDLCNICKRNSGSRDEVVKRFKKNESTVFVEIDTHIKLSAIPGVVRLFSSRIDNVKEIVMEFCANGSLPKYMERRADFSEGELLRHFRFMIFTVREMHKLRYVHRKILAGKWLVTAEGEIILSSFGYAKFISFEGSMKPHSFNVTYTNCIFVQDARMLGVVFLQMAMHEFNPPTKNLTREEVEMRLGHTQYSYKVKDIIFALLFDERSPNQAEITRHLDALHDFATPFNLEDILLYPVEEEHCSYCSCLPQSRETSLKRLPCMHSFCSDCMEEYTYIGRVICRICNMNYAEDTSATIYSRSTLDESANFDDSSITQFPLAEKAQIGRKS